MNQCGHVYFEFAPAYATSTNDTSTSIGQTMLFGIDSVETYGKPIISPHVSLLYLPSVN